MVLVAVFGEDLEKGVDDVVVSPESDTEKTDIVLDEKQMIGGLHSRELVLENGDHLGDGGLPESIDVGAGD